MASRPRELPVPEPAAVDPQATELARIWSTEGTQVVSLRIGVPDPAAWGYTLADLAHHIAIAYQRKSGLDPRKTLRAIKEAFLDEVTHAPADEPTGVRARARTKPKRPTSRAVTKPR